MNSTKTETAPSPRITPEDYNKILRGLNLVSLSLSSCEAKMDPNTAAEVFGKGEPAPVDTRDSGEFASKDHVVVVQHNYSLVSRQKRKTLLSIKADYVLVFESTAEFTQEFFEVFREMALPMYTWPYFREFVASMTERMELPRLQLGLRHTPAF